MVAQTLPLAIGSIRFVGSLSQTRGILVRRPDIVVVRIVPMIR
jgi:hypothetical protein